VNFNYFIGEDSFRYIVEAVKLIARDGWLLLPDYTFCPRSGLWHHRRGRPDPALRLTDLSYRRGRLEYRTRQVTEPEWALDGYLTEARRILDEARGRLAVADLPDDPALSADFQDLRWFPLPREVQAELRGEATPACHTFNR
jgi:hypothetical protein